MRDVERTYLPAAGHNWALPFYDLLVKLLRIDGARNVLLDQAAVSAAHRVLDIGCGTGSLGTLIKTRYPGAEVVGLDPDLKALARARRKAKQAAVWVQFDQGFSDELPYPDASFDRVFSSFMFHHLQEDAKEKTLREVRRVLRPDGSLHMLDFGGPGDETDAFLTRLIHSSHRLKNNFEGRILELMNQAGLTDSKRILNAAVLFGRLRIVYYRASTVTPAPTSGAIERCCDDGALSPMPTVVSRVN